MIISNRMPYFFSAISHFILFLTVAFVFIPQLVRAEPSEKLLLPNNDRIQPYQANPRYWQYKKEPVLLLGGSKTDHIFLLEDLKEHLGEIRAAGGNYVRNTMSQREGKELKPYKLLPNGKFDLNQWNEEYWQRFQNMLEWTHDMGIFVQIELWDRFDYSRDNWPHSPWNPGVNINYTYEETGFAKQYPQHSSQDKQPFFHTIEGMPQYQTQYAQIRRHQEAFAEKMLSYSLKYGHVLYCMNNETTTSAQWGQHWIRFINDKATEMGVLVYATDMFDDAYLAEKAVHTAVIFNNPQMYPFVDISQVNSRVFGEAHWNRLQWLIGQVDKHPRPVNHTKIYGSGHSSFGSGGPEDGVERFWRNIIGGSASARFHRDGTGNGLNSYAKASLKAARNMEKLIKLWDVTPQMTLLTKRAENEAYLAAKPGDYYALYFPKGGSIELDLRAQRGAFKLKFISVSTGEQADERRIKADRRVKITTPNNDGWVAAIVRE